MINKFTNCNFTVGSRQVFGINVLDNVIYPTERAVLDTVKAGDIIYLHNHLQSLEEESMEWLKGLAESVPVVILHGHGHKWYDYQIGGSRVVGMRGLDPDKAIGGFPCINYLDVTENTVEISEKQFAIPVDVVEDVSLHLGISCADNLRDVSYALEHGVGAIELRCNGKDWEPEMTLFPLLEAWRAKTRGYLSVHMPDIKYQDGIFYGKEQWMIALEYAIAVRADALTIHPPKVKRCDILNDRTVWQEYLRLYMLVVNRVPETVKIGIENMHLNKGEVPDNNRRFGYTPGEVSDWIDAMNDAWSRGQADSCRVGHVLDVGHARNNGRLAQQYPIGTWYQAMGKKTVAYHIHQTIKAPTGLKNHKALENWFGPMINYTGFFYAWKQNMLNHVPVFLEVRGCEYYAQSMEGLQELKEVCSEPGYCQNKNFTFVS